MTTVKERVCQYVTVKGISVAGFERLSGLSNGYIKSMKGTFGVEKLENILRAFPDLNREWLLYGRGEMLLADAPQNVTALGGNAIGSVGANAKVQQSVPSSSLDKMIDELSAQRKLTEAANALTKQSQDMLAEAQSAIIKLTQAIIDIKHNGDNQ